MKSRLSISNSSTCISRSTLDLLYNILLMTNSFYIFSIIFLGFTETRITEIPLYPLKAHTSRDCHKTTYSKSRLSSKTQTLSARVVLDRSVKHVQNPSKWHWNSPLKHIEYKLTRYSLKSRSCWTETCLETTSSTAVIISCVLKNTDHDMSRAQWWYNMKRGASWDTIRSSYE